jgi:hypothetical protein
MLDLAYTCAVMTWTRGVGFTLSRTSEGFVTVEDGFRRVFPELDDLLAWLRTDWGGPGPLGEAKRIVAAMNDRRFGL